MEFTEEEDRKTRLKLFFQRQFNELLVMGVPKNLAAAEALVDCKSCTDRTLRTLPKPDSTSDGEPELITACGSLRLFEEAKQTLSYTPIFRLIGKVLADPSKVINSFLLERDGLSTSSIDREGLTTSRTGVSIDLLKVDFFFNLIRSCASEGVQNSLVYSLQSLSNDIRYQAQNCHDSFSIIPFAVILETPDLYDVRYIETLRNLVWGLNALPTPTKLRLVEYVCNLSLERYTKHIDTFQRYITARVDKGAHEEAKLAVAVLSIWYSCRKVFPSISTSMFYNAAINEEYASTRQGKRIEYKFWQNDLELTSGSTGASKLPAAPPSIGRARSGGSLVRVSSGLFSMSIPILPRASSSSSLTASSTQAMEVSVPIPLCCRHRFESLISYPFVLSAGVKAAILELDAAKQMRDGTEAEMERAVATGSRYVIPYLVIRIRRNHIVEDAINQFAAQDDGSFDLKKPLKVVFDGEEGVDEGGVRKEFYQIVTKQLLDPSYGMFKYYEESRSLWFNSDSLESSQGFELIGTLVGVAIYNSVIIDLQMPSVVYKKMKGKEPTTLDDLSTLQPSLAAGLKKLLEYKETYDGEIQSVFDMRFEISYEVFGEMKTVELLDGGSNLVVDASNREMFVDLYVEYLLDKSISTQFDAFAKGFHKVCGGAALDLFEAAELELLICGNPVLDFNELEKGTLYDDGYSKDTRVILDLWSVLHSFDEINKKKFLKFLTGSDRSPIDGLSKLRFVISRNGNEDTRLPSAHTCFNHMLLPEYSCRDVLEKNILFAINESEGFGLR